MKLRICICWLALLSCSFAKSLTQRAPISIRSIDDSLTSTLKDNEQQLLSVGAPQITAERNTTPLPKVETCDEHNAPGRYMIYCSGKLLEAVMAVKLYNDSKTFVDQPMKEGKTGDGISKAFATQFPQPVEQISRDDVQKFVNENFEQEGHELDSCTSADWQNFPKSFKVIKDPTLRMFALNLNSIWKELCRQVKPMVKQSPERFSLLYVPNPFIVPGGRFREFYYWDAYWIIKGLLVSGMTQTAKGMIQNFAHIINTYGLVPNGGRVYYLRRSQPPLFIPMIYDYYQATRDTEFVREMLPVMEKEYQWWNANRALTLKVNGEPVTMYQYRTPATVPRPESYREDVLSAQNITDENKRRLFFSDLGSAAESGWDFSARWFADNVSLTSIETTNIVPVDLNAFMCYNMHILGNLHRVVGNENKGTAWISQYIKFRDQFQKVFYVDNAKGWYDYNLRTQRHNTEFYASMAAPLFTQCYEPLSLLKADDLYNKLEELGVFNYIGGIPSSLQFGSTQQWDFPNGWSPLNHMMIEGLRKSDDPRMQQKAFILAQKWVLANLHVFENDQAMWEKYDVSSAKPRLGGGGEYNVQPGFGWTNGVAIDLLVSYGDRLEYSQDTRTNNSVKPRTSEALRNSFNIVLISAVMITLMRVPIL